MATVEHASSRRYPELRQFESPDEATAVLKSWQKRLMKSPRFWLILTVYTVGVGLFVLLIMISLRRWLNFPPSMYGGIVGGVTGGSGTVVVTWIWRQRCRRYLREQLAARGVPICIKCGYDLRGQIEPRCPECGTPCDERLIASEERRPTRPR